MVQIEDDSTNWMGAILNLYWGCKRLQQDRLRRLFFTVLTILCSSWRSVLRFLQILRCGGTSPSRGTRMKPRIGWPQTTTPNQHPTQQYPTLFILTRSFTSKSNRKCNSSVLLPLPSSPLWLLRHRLLLLPLLPLLPDLENQAVQLVVLWQVA